MINSLGLVQVDEIYLTHFHADHYLGLPGLLKTYDLTDRERPLLLYGPPGLRDLYAVLRPLVGRLHYELELVELKPGEAGGHDGPVGQAASVAREAHVKMLALVHISSRYHVGQVLEEAQDVYEPTVAPKDFDVIHIPFPERGYPELTPNGARDRDGSGDTPPQPPPA